MNLILIGTVRFKKILLPWLESNRFIVHTASFFYSLFNFIMKWWFKKILFCSDEIMFEWPMNMILIGTVQFQKSFYLGWNRTASLLKMRVNTKIPISWNLSRVWFDWLATWIQNRPISWNLLAVGCVCLTEEGKGLIDLWLIKTR